MSSPGDLLYEYCWAHDRRDLDELRRCFSSSIELYIHHPTEAMGVTSYIGLQDVMAMYETVFEQFGSDETRRHFATNVIHIAASDQDVVVRSYIMVTSALASGPCRIMMAGWCEDSLVRTESGWLIAVRHQYPDNDYRAQVPD